MTTSILSIKGVGPAAAATLAKHGFTTADDVAAATAEQARGSEMIMEGADKMRVITQHVERSTQEQASGGKQISHAMESISKVVRQLNMDHRMQTEGTERITELAMEFEGILEDQEHSLARVKVALDAVRDELEDEA